MTPARYRHHRQAIGTQSEAAKRLGVSRWTIIRRERGNAPISRADAMAIKDFSQRKNKLQTATETAKWLTPEFSV